MSLLRKVTSTVTRHRRPRRTRSRLATVALAVVLGGGPLFTMVPSQAIGIFGCEFGSTTRLNECIATANASTDSNITLTLSNNVVIDAAIDAITIPADSSLVIDGNSYSIDFATFAGFDITMGSGKQAEIRYLTTKGGATAGDGAIVRLRDGNLLLRGLKVFGAQATGNGGAVAVDKVTSVVEIVGSSFMNSSAGGSGGGLYSAAAVTMTNSTIYGNTASAGGGAVVSADPAAGVSALQFSTISGNSATSGGSNLAADSPATQIDLVGSVVSDPLGVAAANCKSAVKSGTYAVIGNAGGTDTSCGTEVVNQIDLTTNSAIDFLPYASGTAVLVPAAASSLLGYAPNDLGTGVTTDARGTTRTNPYTVGAVQRAPQASLSPTSVDFGNVATGVTSAASTVTLTNIGSGPLTLFNGDLQISGADALLFAIGSDTCSGATIVAAGTCTFSLTFAPDALGARSATLTLTNSGVATPKTVALAGTGVTPSGGGGGGTDPTPAPSATPIPTPTPTPGAVSTPSATSTPSPSTQRINASLGFVADTTRLITKSRERVLAVVAAVPARATEVRLVVTGYATSTQPSRAETRLAAQRAAVAVAAFRAAGLKATFITEVGLPRGSMANQAGRAWVSVSYLG